MYSFRGRHQKSECMRHGGVCKPDRKGQNVYFLLAGPPVNIHFKSWVIRLVFNGQASPCTVEKTKYVKKPTRQSQVDRFIIGNTMCHKHELLWDMCSSWAWFFKATLGTNSRSVDSNKGHVYPHQEDHFEEPGENSRSHDPKFLWPKNMVTYLRDLHLFSDPGIPIDLMGP